MKLINKIIISILLLILSIIIYMFKYNLQFKVWLINIILVSRGLITTNCKWFKISDIILGDDASGVNLYNSYKKKYGDFAETNMFGKKINVVTKNEYIKTILDNSPDLFNVGKIKQTFFRTFMSKNVGVSSGCPWKSRRQMNEFALDSDKLHQFASKYNDDINKELIKRKNEKSIKYDDFNELSKLMAAKIVFNTDKLDDDVFKIFSEANTTEVFHNPNFKIDPEIHKKYMKILNQHIDNPNEKSLVKLCVDSLKSANNIKCPSIKDNRDEIIHQIPHFIFPIIVIFVRVIPLVLLLLCNHPKAFKKVVDEIYSLNQGTNQNYGNPEDISKKIYKLTFLRKCILESLRLNNPLTTTFRTLEKDYTFDDKYSFKKGEQFLILHNPVLREKEFFEEPNKFIPTRWTNEMEKSYYAISFGQGPQRCPGKELVIYISQCFIYNLVVIKNIGRTTSILSNNVDTQNIPQVFNPCNAKFQFI